jgi:hypothetical protein
MLAQVDLHETDVMVAEERSYALLPPVDEGNGLSMNTGHMEQDDVISAQPAPRKGSLSLDSMPSLEIPTKTWVLVFLTWFACIICGGILPGQAIFTRLFADAGIFIEVCEGFDTQAACPDQYLALANLFGLLMNVAFMAILLSGVLLTSSVAGCVGSLARPS